MLDTFRFINYLDFKDLGRLPIGDACAPESTKMSASKVTMSSEDNKKTDVFVVFFSYRWLGATSEPQMDGPDDSNNTQYMRMLHALDLFLDQRKDLDPGNLGTWLVSACTSHVI